MSSYSYVTVNRLKPGQIFQFASGATINRVVHVERALLVYTNMLTMKTRRLKFLPVSGVWPLRYCKDLDGMFENYYTFRKETDECPF